MILLDWVGVLAILYAVFRALQSLADWLVRRDEVRDVMSGRALPPWDEPPLMVRRGIYNVEHDDSFPGIRYLVVHPEETLVIGEPGERILTDEEWKHLRDEA